MKQINNIDIHKIKCNPFQPRSDFEASAIMDLAQSIRENGLIQPISVRLVDNEYELIAGERRLRASKMNGETQISAVVYDVNDLQMAEMALVENVQRENLSAIEEAKAYIDIMKLSNITQSELALKVGKSQSSVANKIRLLNLDENIQEAVSNKTITERHARALIGSSKEKQHDILKTIIKKGLNVAQTENLVQVETQINKEERGSVKGFSKNVRVAVNTIKQAVKLVEKSGNQIEYLEQDKDDIVTITIHIKK